MEVLSSKSQASFSLKRDDSLQLYKHGADLPFYKQRLCLHFIKLKEIEYLSMLARLEILVSWTHNICALHGSVTARLLILCPKI